jgi:hypothetical protein
LTDDSKPKTIKELQKEIPSIRDVGQRLAMALRAEDYKADMLSANLLEYMLKKAIITKFIPLGNDPLESIFSDGGNGPLSTFSAKIKLAYALGIVSAETRLQIERVKEIRNHFAHHKDKVSFKDPSVISVCGFFKQRKGLPLKESILTMKMPTPKVMYVQTCFFVALDFKMYIKRLGTIDPMELPIDSF